MLLVWEPLGFEETEIDHVIAESLADDPVGFSSLLQNLGLPEAYNVNDFSNSAPGVPRVQRAERGDDIPASSDGAITSRQDTKNR